MTEPFIEAFGVPSVAYPTRCSDNTSSLVRWRTHRLSHSPCRGTSLPKAAPACYLRCRHYPAGPDARRICSMKLVAPGKWSAEAAEAKFPNLAGYEVQAFWAAAAWVSVLSRHAKPRLKLPCRDQMIIAGRHAPAELVARFGTEAEAVAEALVHPNIVAVYEIGDTPQGPCSVLARYIGGGNLKDRLDGTPWPASERLNSWPRWLEADPLRRYKGAFTATFRRPMCCFPPTAFRRSRTFGLAKLLVDDGAAERTRAPSSARPCYMAPEQAG